MTPSENFGDYNELFGSLSALDPVGNVIVRDIKLQFERNNYRLIYAWDGRNHVEKKNRVRQVRMTNYSKCKP